MEAGWDMSRHCPTLTQRNARTGRLRAADLRCRLGAGCQRPYRSAPRSDRSIDRCRSCNRGLGPGFWAWAFGNGLSGGFALWRLGYPNAATKGVGWRKVSQSVEVSVSVRVAYNQWTQFELFPQFMEGIEQVTQLDDTRLRWVADIGGKRHEWDAEITEQTPDTRIAWRRSRATTTKA